MIQDWRKQWNNISNGTTDAAFPFGYVQLNGVGDPAKKPPYANPTAGASAHNDYGGGFPGIRWAQSGGCGYNPNPKQPNTFNAVILDTANYDGGIHSAFKQPAGSRLARASLVQAYGMASTVFSTPHVKSITPMLPPSRHTSSVHSSGGGDINNGGNGGGGSNGSSSSSGFAAGTIVIGIENANMGVVLHTNGSVGFEVLFNNTWLTVPIISYSTDTVTVGNVPSTATRIRYLWYSNACGINLYSCPVYVKVPPLHGGLSGEESFLPLGPFVADLVSSNIASIA